MSRSFNFQPKQLRRTLNTLLPGARKERNRPATVLIVDDEPLIVAGLAAILDREGFTVLTAFDAHSALKIAQKAAPDILITDVNMPGMDGIELGIRLTAAIPAAKVLLFSANYATLQLSFAPQTGNQPGHHFSLISKPVHPQQMLDRVRETLKGESALA